MYIGHMMHFKMQKLDIVDKLCDLGFSISSDSGY